jgi:hypothetical protein
MEKGAGPNVSQNGISPVQLASDILSKYDFNGNSKLEVSTESFLRVKTEGLVKTESRGLLFTDADNSGNKDGITDSLELLHFLDLFDTDRDGEITTFKNMFHSMRKGNSEWSKFEDQYGERFSYSTADN